MNNNIKRRQFLEMAALASGGAALHEAAAENIAMPANDASDTHAAKALHGPPYKLQGNRIVFPNWTFVLRGLSAWQNEAGENVGVSGNVGPDAALLHPRQHAHISRNEGIPFLRS